MSFEGMSKMLFDPNLLAREACGWAICRMTTARDGVDTLCNSSLIKVMSESFNKYTEKMTRELAKFNIYLLEAFSRILEYDNGIKYFVNCGVVKRMN